MDMASQTSDEGKPGESTLYLFFLVILQDGLLSLRCSPVF